MKDMHQKHSEEAWENRNLGASEEFARKSSPEREKALDESLGLQTISIRLQKALIEDLKNLAEDDRVEYQPYRREGTEASTRCHFTPRK